MILEHPIKWDDEKVSRLWDYYAHSSPVPYFSDMHGGALLKMSKVPLDRPLRVLDFGCGPGYIWNHLRRFNSRWKYSGVDFSPTSIQVLQEKAAGDPHLEHVSHISRLPTPLDPSSYDVVLLFEVVEHLDDDKLHAALTEARRLLKPGGLLVVSTPNDEDLPQSTKFCPECASIFHEWQHVRTWTKESLSRYMAGYGLKPRFVTATDLNTIRLKGWLVDKAKRLLNRGYKAPHMLGVFVKADA